MTSQFKKQNGIVIAGILILVVFASSAIFFLLKNSRIISRNSRSPSNITQSPSPTTTLTPTTTSTPTPSATATPTPTITPTPSPAPSPTPTLTPVPTPTATPKPQSGPPPSGYSRYTIATEKGNFLIDVISIDVSTARMITDTASDNDCAKDCPTIPLSDFVSRNSGFAGINGTYFCPQDYADCASKKNSFDFPVFNSRSNKWINAGNLFWNDRSMIHYDGSMHFFHNANSYSGQPKAGIVNHPGLLENGNIIAGDFPLSDKQKTKGSKGGIGFKGNRVYLVLARNVDVFDFAAVFKSLGADNALNLDGGGSSALWFNGYKVGPGRNLPNAVIFAR